MKQNGEINTEQILTAIGLVGIGGLLKSFLGSLMAQRKAKSEAKHSVKEIRYRAIILLAYALLHYEREKSTLIINRPDIESKSRLQNELEAELINMYLFASDKVVLRMQEFIEKLFGFK